MTTPQVAQLKERLMAWAGDGPHREEMLRARADFFRASGEVRDEEPCFEPVMDAFVDWYLCDRPMEAMGTPVERFLKEQQGVLPAAELEPFQALARTRPGVFLLEGMDEGTIRVRDLFTMDRLVVHERRRLVGVGRGDVFHARLVPLEDGWFFTGFPLFHPTEVRGQVRKVLRHARKAGAAAYAEAQQQLFQKRVKVDRYRHVPPPDLYRDIVPRGLFPLW
ncbi:MAG: hypothetical protein HY904_04460 [Deltaproteobacteria bacterium]|nr:hypothetical protein [Deltaproteobacteria bacterium]